MTHLDTMLAKYGEEPVPLDEFTKAIEADGYEQTCLEHSYEKAPDDWWRICRSSLDIPIEKMDMAEHYREICVNYPDRTIKLKGGDA